jgi:hypothetical protein
MNLFASCPTCKLSLQLLPPEPSKEYESRLLLNTTELLPLRLNEQARWLGVCPSCQAEFVPLSYRLSPKRDGEWLASVMPLRQHRELRESSLRQLGGQHLGKMLTESSPTGCLLSSLIGLLWSFFTLDVERIKLFCGALVGVFLLSALHHFISSLGQLSFEVFTSFVVTVAWLLIASLMGRIELLVVLGVFLPCWFISLRGVLKQPSADALLAVEQELLQLRRLPVTPRYWAEAKGPYR